MTITAHSRPWSRLFLALTWKLRTDCLHKLVISEVSWNWMGTAIPYTDYPLHWLYALETELQGETRKREWDFRLDPCNFRFWLFFSVFLRLVKAEQTCLRIDHRIQSQNELHYQSQLMLSSCLLEQIQPFLSTVVGTQQQSEGEVTHLENSPWNHSAREAVWNLPILFLFLFLI